MATKLLSMLAGALVLLAPLVVCQGGGSQQLCDKHRIALCYWSVADEHGTDPIASSAYEKDTFLKHLCNGKLATEPGIRKTSACDPKMLRAEQSNPQRFPEDNRCKQEYHGRCTDAEKKKFARMERGYTVLRGGITSAESCQAVQQLRECMDLSTMSSCDASPDPRNGTFQAEVEAKERGAQNLKACVEEAVKPCDVKKNAAAIAHLQKIADAIVDLSSSPDKPNGAHTTKAAKAVVAVSLLSWIVGYFY